MLGTIFLSTQTAGKDPLQGMVCLMGHEGFQHPPEGLVGLTLDAAAAHPQAPGVRFQGGLTGELVSCQVPAEEREARMMRRSWMSLSPLPHPREENSLRVVG